MARAAPPSDLVLAIDVEQPFILWPAAVRARFEHDTMIAAAGEIAERYFYPRLGRLPASVSEQAAAALATLPEAGAIDRHEIASALAADLVPGHTDEDLIAQAARACHGSDLVSGVAWVDYLVAQTTRLVALHEDDIVRLAYILDSAQVLSAEQVAAVAGRP